MLVPRLVDGCDKGHWHICPADWRFSDSAIVTLEALCGFWCFGSLTRDGFDAFWEHHPDATICPQCLEEHYAAEGGRSTGTV